MYRVDMVAAAIFPRARAWTRALFFSAHVQPGDYLLYFTQGAVLEIKATEQYSSLLLMSPDPDDHVASHILQYNMHGSADQPMHWTEIFGTLDMSRTKPRISWSEDTDQMQRQLNRIRRREEILKLSINRARGSAALFTPDMSSIARMAAVPESTVRGYFDGRATNAEARDKILWAFGITSDEMEGKLWEPGRAKK